MTAVVDRACRQCFSEYGEAPGGDGFCSDACAKQYDLELAPRRVWLVGERNPYGADPRFALYPRPANAAGARLMRALGLVEREYLRAFERRNLLSTPKWSAPLARRAADALLAGHPRGDRLVLLGARVSAAFGCAFREDLCEPMFVQVGTDVLRGRCVLVVPHPSGLSRAWNDPEMVPRVRAAVERLRDVETALPDEPR